MKIEKKLRIYQILAAVSLSVLLYVYFAIMIFGNLLYNRAGQAYVPMITKIPFVAFLNNYGVLSGTKSIHALFIGDAVLFLSFLAAAASLYLYNYQKAEGSGQANKRTLALGRVILYLSLFVALLILLSVESAENFTPWALYQFIALLNVHNSAPPTVGGWVPYWTYSVTYSTCFTKMPGWSIEHPYCYAINYEELFIGSISGIIIGTSLVIKSHKN